VITQDRDETLLGTVSVSKIYRRSRFRKFFRVVGLELHIIYNIFVLAIMFAKTTPHLMGLILGGTTCNGDSGGGLVVEKEKGRYQLWGVLSSGIKGCDEGSYSLFSSVFFHKNWIQHTIGELGASEIVSL